MIRDTKAIDHYHKLLQNPVRHKKALKFFNQKMGPIWTNIMIKGNPNVMKCPNNCKDTTNCAYQKHMTKVINRSFSTLTPNNINSRLNAPFKTAEKHHLAILEENKRQLDQD